MWEWISHWATLLASVGAPTVSLLVVLAQVTEPVTGLAGNAGWAGAGLLGLVLAWLLLWHLPAKDKQIKDLVDSKDALVTMLTTRHADSVDKILDKYTAGLKEARDEFRDWLQIIAANDAASIKSLTEAIGRDMIGLHEAIKSLREK